MPERARDEATSGDTPEAPGLAAFLRERVELLLAHDTDDRLEGLYPVLMREVERTLLETVLAHTGGHRERAARLLGLHRNSLALRLRAVGLAPTPPAPRRRGKARS